MTILGVGFYSLTH